MNEAARTVLVVDDDPDVRAFAMSVLEDAGYDVLGAGGGIEALSLLEDHPEIGLLLIDVVMPGIDGIMLADMAKTRRPDVRVVYASGCNDVARSLPGIIHGAMLAKPYRPAQLASEVGAAFAA